MTTFDAFTRGARRVAAILCLALPAQLSVALADDFGTLSWETRAPVIAVGECGVEGSAASVIDGRIYVSHGFSCGDSAALRIYDIHTDTWTLGPAASVPRSELAGVTVGGKHYAIGGRISGEVSSVLSDVEIFDPASGTWSTGPSMPTARAGLCATVLDGKIHVIGGRDGITPGTGSPLAVHEVFDPGENSWSTKASLPTAVMDNYACVALDGRIYVFGGAGIEEEGEGEGGVTVTGATQIYDPGEDEWMYGESMPSPRSNAVAGVLNSHPIVVGGAVPDFEAGFLNVSTVSIYHPDGDSCDDYWTAGPSKPTAGSEFGAAMIVSGNVLFAVGSGIEGESSNVHEALVVSAPVCTGTPADGGVNGTATSSSEGIGLVSAELAPGASNVSLECATCPFPLTECDPTPCATLGGVSEIFFRATSTGGDAQGTVVVKDAAGGSCTTTVTITSLPAGPVRDQTVCAGGGTLLRESNDTSLGSGATSSCGGSVLEPDDPLLPAEYAPSPAGDPFPCRVFTLDAPYSGDTQEIYKVDGDFNPRLRLLFSAQDGSGSFPPYTDVTQSVEPIFELADPTKLSGGTRHSLIKITCAVLKEVCDGADNDGVGGVDGFTTFCGTGQCAASGTCTAGVDSCVAGTPSAEVCDGIDNDCDGAVPAGEADADHDGVRVCAGDCNDSSAASLPGELEVCDGLDNDCDGEVDGTFGGYLQPVNADGSSVFNSRQRTIPFKFQLRDCAGSFISTATATIEVTAVANAVTGSVLETVSSAGNANTGNFYRYDPTSDQYIYNLSGPSLPPGKTYLVRTTITRPQGVSTHDVKFSLK